MRLTSHVLPDGTPSCGRVDGDQIIDAGAALRAQYPDLKALLAADAVTALENADGPVRGAEQDR